MRFEKIRPFNIDDLMLDEDNYRFTKAKDQKACVKKIYHMNKLYFKGLMKSIAEDDLGETLLVYTNENGDNIVADGNRRLSALKVLHNDDYAPDKQIEAYAKELREANTLDFTNIQAQVSSNKELVAKTVHERHSGGGNGTRRQDWKAYANARFGFDNKVGDHKEWYIMALLVRTEEEHPELEINGTAFPYETYRRIIRTALAKKRISENIFAERGAHIKKTARPDLVKDAVFKSLSIIQALESKELSLSRKDNTKYADKSNIDAYIEGFELSPDNAELEQSKQASSQSGDETAQSKSSQKNEDNNGGRGSSSSDTTNKSQTVDDVSNSNSGSTGDETSENQNSSNKGITKSVAIAEKLDLLGSKKLKGLYKSMYNVPLNTNPQLMYIGAWAFLEVLAKLAGNENNNGDRTTEFPGFYRNKFREFGINKQNGKDCGLVLDEISRYGNATKHSRNCTPMTAIQLENHFEVLEDLIKASIDRAISLKEKERAA